MAKKKNQDDQNKIDSFIFNATYKGDKVTELLYLSGKVKQVVGLSKKDYEKRLLENSVDDLIHSEDKKRVQEERKKIFDSNVPGNIIYRFVDKGSERWVEEKLFPNQSNPDQPVLCGIMQNIDSQIGLINKLKESEKKYRDIFEKNLAGVYRTHVDGTIIDCNQSFATILGYKDPEEIKKFRVQDLYYEQKDRQPYIDRLRKEGTLYHYVSTLKTKDGRRLVLDNNVSISPDENGELNIVEGTFIDITPLEKTKEALEESRRSFENIVDNSLSAILLFSEEELVYTNPRGNSLIDDALNKRSKNLFKIFPKNEEKLIREILKKSVKDSGFHTEIELGKKGKEKVYSINVAHIVHNEKPSQMFVLRDISLQQEYHFQKHRAELAEVSNKELQKEIAKHERTQEELTEKTSILKSFQESSGNLFILSLDKEYRLTSMNTNYVNSIKHMLGSKVKIGDVFLDVFKKEDGVAEKFHKRFREAFKGKPQQLVSHFPTKQGKEFWVETFINPIYTKGNKIEQISCVAHDITEKVEIEEKIIQSEASMRATLLAIPDFIFRVNKKGVFTDSRMRDELGPIRQFLTTANFVGKKVTDVFKNKEIAKEFLDNLKIALGSDGLHTQHFSFYIGSPKSGNKRFFENRFSKISEEEVVVISRDITEAMEYESRLIESVREKEVLLKEVHHRVKNNLQVINSILNLQSSYVDDPDTLEIINESQNRIRSMSYIHESLYQTKDFNSINFHDYITTLVQNLVHSYQLYGKETKLELDVDKVDLALDQAIPCGLILNELVSNCLKYAYPGDDEKGVISIKIKEKSKDLIIEVEDFGVGLPKGFKIEDSDSLGLSLVDTLVHQLEGELHLKTKSGTKFYIIFEKQEI